MPKCICNVGTEDAPRRCKRDATDGGFCWQHGPKKGKCKLRYKEVGLSSGSSAAHVPRSPPRSPPKAKTPPRSPPKTSPRSPLPAGPSGRVSPPRSPPKTSPRSPLPAGPSGRRSLPKTPPRSPLPAGPSGRISPDLTIEQALERKPRPFNVWEQEPRDRINTIKAIQGFDDVVYKTIMNKVEERHFEFMSTRASVLLARDGQVPEDVKHGDIILYSNRSINMAQMDDKGELQIVRMPEDIIPPCVRRLDIDTHTAVTSITLPLKLVRDFHPFYWNVDIPILNYAVNETSHYRIIRIISKIPFEYFKDMRVTSDISIDNMGRLLNRCYDMYNIRIRLEADDVRQIGPVHFAPNGSRREVDGITYIPNNIKEQYELYNSLEYVYTNYQNLGLVNNSKSKVCKKYYLLYGVPSPSFYYKSRTVRFYYKPSFL